MDERFYQLVKRPEDENEAANVAINVSVSRNPTYSENLTDNDKLVIHKYWESLLLEFYKKHKQRNVCRKDFFCYVDTIKESMNSRFFDSFQNDTEGYDKEFRLAHAQKSLSVFLKHLWCMGKMKEPPFCPIDGIILHDVLRKKGTWTKLNDKETYNKYIEYVDNAAKDNNMSVAEWEYLNWNKAVVKSNQKKIIKKQLTKTIPNANRTQIIGVKNNNVIANSVKNELTITPIDNWDGIVHHNGQRLINPLYRIEFNNEIFRVYAGYRMGNNDYICRFLYGVGNASGNIEDYSLAKCVFDKFESNEWINIRGNLMYKYRVFDNEGSVKQFRDNIIKYIKELDGESLI